MRLALVGLAAGVVVAFSLPPWGFWPLGILGFALLAQALVDQPAKRRAVIGVAFGFGMFSIGLFWITEFQAFGFVALLILETSFFVGAAVATPPGAARLVAFPAAIVLGETLRGLWPFGGLPLAGAALGQAAGPLAPAVRIGGPLLLLGITAVAGVAMSECFRRRIVGPVIALVVVVAIPLAGSLIHTTAGAPMRVAAVQGGGVRGLRAVDAESDPVEVYENHLEATGQVQRPVALVVWPEDVVDLEDTLEGSPEEEEIGGLAESLRATLVAGIVEGAGPDHFRNAAVAWGPNGEVVDRYDKVHRVPFGEYIPGRDLIRHIANLDLIPRDAIAGTGPGLLRTPAGRLGVVISYEVFFADRARATVRAGGEVVLVPTNASSFQTSQVPTQEVAAAQLRALETGRDVVQSAPTGYAAIIDSNGKIRQRSTLGRQEVLQGVIHRRHGQTPYVRWGDGPALLTAFTLLAAGWVSQRRNTTA